VDPATLIGIVLAFVAITTAMILEGSSPMSIILFPPMLLVFGGTIGVGLAGGMLKDFTGSVIALKRAFGAKVPPADDTVTTLVGLAEQARRNGLLALEESAGSIEDPYLRNGLQLLVDGTDPDELRDIMETELDAKKASDKTAAKLFTDMGGYAPTIGIIGTVVGLVHVLENLSEPEKLGHLIAGAFVATLWGVMSANLMWLPLGSKLKRLGEVEARRMELVLEGIMSIQAGSNPRVVEQKLLSFLPDRPRPADDELAA
jgi:chemotaxis protein MotA